MILLKANGNENILGGQCDSSERERVLIRRKVWRLFSFYYHGKNREFHDEFKYRISHNEDISSR